MLSKNTCQNVVSISLFSCRCSGHALMLLLGIFPALLSGCGSINRSADSRQEQVKQQVVSIEAVTEDVDTGQTFFTKLERRYESYRKPLTLNAWRKAVGDSVEDVSGYAKAETAFFSDNSIDERLRVLAQSNDAEISERAKGWLRLRNQSGMDAHASIAALQNFSV